MAGRFSKRPREKILEAEELGYLGPQNFAFSQVGNKIYPLTKKGLVVISLSKPEQLSYIEGEYPDMMVSSSIYFYFSTKQGDGKTGFKFLDLETDQVLGQVQGLEDRLMTIKAHPEKEDLVAGWYSGKLSFCQDIKPSYESQEPGIYDTGSAITQMKYSKNGDYLVLSTGENNILSFDTRGTVIAEEVAGNLKTQSRNKKYILLEDLEGLTVYNLEKREVDHRIENRDDFYGASFLGVYGLSDDGKFLAYEM